MHSYPKVACVASTTAGQKCRTNANVCWTELHKRDALFILTWPAFLNAHSGSSDTSRHVKVHSANVLQSFHFAIFFIYFFFWEGAGSQPQRSFTWHGWTRGVWWGHWYLQSLSPRVCVCVLYFILENQFIIQDMQPLCPCGQNVSCSYRLHMFLIDYEWETYDTVNLFHIHSRFATAGPRPGNPNLAAFVVIALVGFCCLFCELYKYICMFVYISMYSVYIKTITYNSNLHTTKS